MDKEQRNLERLRDFLIFNNKDFSCPMITISCNVEYTSKILNIHGTANAYITIDAYNAGKIEISGDKFDPSKIFTGFSAKYQTYQFSKVDNALVISGSEKQKMHGEYRVRLTVLS